MKPFRFSISDIAFAILLWTLMIWKYGYIYGSSDHEELLVYVLFLKNQALYAHDFFVQSLHGSTPNERSVMAQILLPFSAHLSITIFLFHFVNTVLVILAFVRIASRFIINRYVAWVAVFTSFFILYNRALGGVDNYSAAFQTGDLSVMVAAWSLLYFIDGRYVLSSVLISIASFIHVLVGFDLMAVFCAVMLWKYLIDREITLSQLASFFGIYICTAGIYLLLVFRAKSSGNGSIPDEELYNIMFLFRHPHHFIFRTFPLYTKVLFVIYTTAALVYYRYMSRTIFQFVVFSTIVLMGYIWATDYGHIILVASFQWFKVIAWVKLLGTIAIIGGTYSYVRKRLPADIRWADVLVGVSGLVAGVLVFYLFFHGDIAHGYKQQNEDEIMLSLKVKEVIPEDAIFIQPFDFTAFKYYAQRSSYIDFKAIAKNKKDTREWYRRIQEVYGLSYDMPETGFLMEQKADAYYEELPELQLAHLKEEGVTHMISRNENYKQKHKLILAEKGYFVYEL